jgi:hypothetical protein
MGGKQLAKAKTEEVKPIEEDMREYKEYFVLLLKLKDKKIPFYEKLPKEHQFYKHFMLSLEHSKMSKAAYNLVEDGKRLFQGAMLRMQEDSHFASTHLSPGLSPKKRRLYG